MIGRTATCPACGTQIAWRDKPSEFPCDGCGAWLRAGSGLERLLFPPLILIMLLAGLVYGHRVQSTGSLAAMTLAVIQLLAHLRYIGLFKPRLELLDHHRGSFDHVQVPAPPVAIDTLDAVAVEDTTGVAGVGDRRKRRLFEFPNPPRTLEGIAIGLVAVTLFTWQLVVYAEPVVVWAYPEYRATRVGPRGFPLTIHIGHAALRLTNESDEGWYCDVTIGRPPSRFTLPTAARIEAHSAVEVPLEEFHNLDVGPDASIRERAARNGMRARCAGARGRYYAGNF
jgi:hypothetical protein